jgi:hypothetical protein
VVACGGGAEAGTEEDGLPFFPAFVQKLDQSGALEQQRREAVGPLPPQRGPLRSVSRHVEGKPSPELDA